MERERLVDVAALAAYLGVKESWVYGKTAIGGLPCIRVGRYLRFRVTDVLAWMEGTHDAT
ncbi:MAG: helix-turn-helix domain-containing protein [Coriobacteriia bacterium]|nr:helix-turn-helix domain-containing protein [Coriobacteriia bacterium]